VVKASARLGRSLYCDGGPYYDKVNSVSVLKLKM